MTSKNLFSLWSARESYKERNTKRIDLIFISKKALVLTLPSREDVRGIWTVETTISIIISSCLRMTWTWTAWTNITQTPRTAVFCPLAPPSNSVRITLNIQCKQPTSHPIKCLTFTLSCRKQSKLCVKWKITRHHGGRNWPSWCATSCSSAATISSCSTVYTIAMGFSWTMVE